jgi:hypothetical protein
MQSIFTRSITSYHKTNGYLYPHAYNGTEAGISTRSTARNARAEYEKFIAMNQSDPTATASCHHGFYILFAGNVSPPNVKSIKSRRATWIRETHTQLSRAARRGQFGIYRQRLNDIKMHWTLLETTESR